MEAEYTPEDGNLVQLFYVPALNCANRYDRSTGFFSATALTLAARASKVSYATTDICG